MTAGDLNAYLRGLHAVLELSVDRIIVGRASAAVRALGTAWTPYLKTCQASLARGVTTLVVHEPTFYTHWDLDETENGHHRAPDYHVYRTRPRKAVEVARDFACKLAPLDQPGVAFYGDPDYEVETVGLGTGYLSDPLRFMDMTPDLFITIDDCIHTWTQGVFYEDPGRPPLVIHHGTSEEGEMRRLSEKLAGAFPDLPVTHVPQGCGYRRVTPGAGRA